MEFNLERLATVQLVPLTPFSPDGATLLPEVLGAFARSVYEAGIRVFLPAAGTGEFHSLTAAEAISAATINGAHALLLAERKGTIEDGKDADLAVFSVNDYRELGYWFGTNLCETTVVAGEVVSRKC